MGPELRIWIQTHSRASQVPSHRPRRPREGPAREKAESALNDKKTPKINNWIRNSPIAGFKTHLQNHPAEPHKRSGARATPGPFYDFSNALADLEQNRQICTLCIAAP